MLWGPAESHEAATKKVVDQFNAENEYGITVDVQMIPWEGYYQTFLTAVTSGAAPDVATGATPQPIQYAVMGESLDLDPIMEQWKAEGSSVLTEISDDLWEFFQYEGKQYGIAFGLDRKTINYRTDYFEEAGITELPTTWDICNLPTPCEPLKKNFRIESRWPLPARIPPATTSCPYSLLPTKPALSQRI